MRFLRGFRFSIATLLMLVVTTASASALFAKVKAHSELPTWPSWKYDSPTLMTLAIGLTAVALGALKDHTSVQTMLQATIAYLGYLSLIWLAEAGRVRILLYWFQTAFALTVALPLVGRKLVKSGLPRGPRRSWWKKTCEAFVFSFLNILMVAAGALIQFIVVEAGSTLLP